MGDQKEVINFVGIGAEKAATSWLFAVLFEHPEICIPEKELNLFNQIDFDAFGSEYLTRHFSDCSPSSSRGEFSTGYIESSIACKNLHKFFPKIKIIVSLRNPIDRAVSNYRNDLKAGRISKSLDFDQALQYHPEYISRGKYKSLLKPYFNRFSLDNIHFILYDDIKGNPKKVIRTLYSFLEVNENFIPSVWNRRINVSYVPKNTTIEKWSNWLASSLRNLGFHGLWWRIKQSGIPRRIRRINTVREYNLSYHSGNSTLRNHFIEDINFVKKIMKKPNLNW